MARTRNPTESTIRQLFASQKACAHPDCDAPLIEQDSRGNRVIVAEIAHILTAQADGVGPRPWEQGDYTEDQIRGYDNLLLLCPSHHKMVDTHWHSYSAVELRRWKAEAEVQPADANLEPDDLAAVVQRLNSYVEEIVGGPELTICPGAAQVQKLMSHHSVFGDRDQHLEALDAFLTDVDTSRLLVYEPLGRGKTALLVDWVRRVEAVGKWQVVFLPVSRRFETAEMSEALGGLAFELGLVHDQGLRRDDLSPDRLPGKVCELLGRSLPDGVRLVVVLDGIDETVGWNLSSRLFPSRLPGNLKLIASASAEALGSREEWLAQLGWPRSEIFEFPRLDAFEAEEVAKVLNGLGGIAATLADDAEAFERFMLVSEGDPLAVKIIATDLNERVLTPRQLGRRSPGLKPYFNAALTDAREKSSTEAVYQLLGLCAVAKAPMIGDDLAALAPDVLGRAGTQEAAARSISRYLIGDGSKGSGYDFNHPALRRLYLDGQLAVEVKTLRRRFEDWGTSVLSHDRADVPDYLRRFWISHLVDNNAWDDITQHLLSKTVVSGVGRQRWAAIRHGAEGSYTGYLSDLEMLWERAESASEPVTAVRCALVAASIHSLAGNMPPRFPALMASIAEPGVRWKPTAALAHIEAMPDSQLRTQALTALVEEVDELPTRAVLDLAMATAADDWDRTRILVALAPHLDEKLAVEAAALASGVARPGSRIQVLVALLPRLPEPDRTDRLNEALGLQTRITDHDSQRIAYTALAPHLPEPAIAPALTAACALDDQRKGWALRALAPRLPKALLQQALAGAKSISDEHDRADVLEELAPRLPEPLVAEALAATKAIDSIWDRTRALAALAPRLDEPILMAALDRSGPTGALAQAWAAVAPHFSESSQAEAVARAWTLAMSLTGRWPDEVVEALIPQLEEPQRGAALSRALEMAMTETGYGRLGQALSALAPHLDDGQLATALELTAGVDGAWERKQGLAALAPHLQEQHTLGAVGVADSIEYVNVRAEALIDLVPHLPEPQRTDVLVRTQAMTTDVLDDPARSWFLATLVPHLPETQRPGSIATALNLAEAAGSPWAQAAVAITLAPQLADSERRNVVEKGLAAAGSIDHLPHRAGAVAALAAHLEEPQKARALAPTLRAIGEIDDHMKPGALRPLGPELSAELLAEAHAMAEAIDFGPWRVQAMVVLAPWLPELERPAIVASALATARRIPADLSRAQALTELAPHLPPTDRDDAVAMALAALATERSEFWRAQLLSALAPQMQTSHIPAALRIFDGLTDGRWRAQALAALAPHLVEPERSDRLGKALLTASAITSAGGRAAALTALAPEFPDPAQGEILRNALAAAAEMTDDPSRNSALRALAPHLASSGALCGPSGVEAFAAQCRASSRRGRDRLNADLAVLTPWLAELLSTEDLSEIANAVSKIGEFHW